MPKRYGAQNQLTGEVALGSLPRGLRKLMLSHNRFSGTICLQDLPGSMVEVWLDHNKFNGRVEFHELPPGLRGLCLDYNEELYGKVHSVMLPLSLKSLEIGGTGIRREFRSVEEYEEQAFL